MEGELYKEGKSWPHNWERRYFVLWPKRACAAGSVADTARRYQLLFYFKGNPNCTSNPHHNFEPSANL